MDWKLVVGEKKVILNAALERTWYYVFSENLVSVKYVCAWKVPFRTDKGVQKSLENIYVVERFLCG